MDDGVLQQRGGIGAVINTANVEAGTTAVVFGLGGIGLNVIQGLRIAGADMIIGVDRNNDKQAWGARFGVTHFVNPKEIGGDIVPYLVNMTKRGADQIGGADYTFDCTGNVKVMRQALEASHCGWGQSIIIGVAGAGQEIATRPFQLVTGRTWKGTAFGGARGRTNVPKIVDWLEDRVFMGELALLQVGGEPFTTGRGKSLDAAVGGHVEQDFSRYLLTVEERDIDLLLMEEFHISPSFVSWFAGQVGVTDAEFAGAWHSVSDHDGETDLLLRVIASKERIAILIENKIAAPEQSRQDERYHIRGARSRDAGLFDVYTTCICAPAAYLAGLNENSLYEHRASYEVIRDWYAQFDDARSVWRCRIMTEAIEQGRRGYVMVVNADKSAFHKHYWEYLQRKHPKLMMRQPKEKGSKSDWIILKTHDMPKGVSIDHKNDQGCVDLTFNRTRLDDLLAVKAKWPDDIMPLQRGGSTVLRKIVPKLDMTRAVADQLEELEEVLAAAYSLLAYSRILQAR